MFSNIKDIFLLTVRCRDPPSWCDLCVDSEFSHLLNIFSPQPDYEQQLMDESRFRQQLEARNNKSKKNDRKHGKYLCVLLVVYMRLFSCQMTRTTADCAPGYPTSPSPGPRRRRSGRSRRGARASTRGSGPWGTSGARGDITWCGAAPSGDTWTTVSGLRSQEVTATQHCLCLRSTWSNSRHFYNIRNSWHFNTAPASTLQCTVLAKERTLSLNYHIGRSYSHKTYLQFLKASTWRHLRVIPIQSTPDSRGLLRETPRPGSRTSRTEEVSCHPLLFTSQNISFNKRNTSHCTPYKTYLLFSHSLHWVGDLLGQDEALIWTWTPWAYRIRITLQTSTEWQRTTCAYFHS